MTTSATAATAAYEPTTDQRNWAAISHLSAFVQFIGIPSLVGPLILWLVKKDEPFVSEQAKEALNFNISMTIWFIASLFAIVLLVGIVLLPLVAISWFVCVIVATVRASQGDEYEYPFTIRFIP